MAAVLRRASQRFSSINADNLGFARGRWFSSKLFVKGIPFSSTEEALAEAFSKFGQVTEAKIITSKETNRSKGYGYVTFATEYEAKMALSAMNGKLLDGRVIFVDKVRPDSEYNYLKRMKKESQKSSVDDC